MVIFSPPRDIELRLSNGKENMSELAFDLLFMLGAQAQSAK